jgi:hypothetical protein
MTLRSLRTVLDTIPALATERSFVVADGGQIPWSEATDALLRSFRMLVTRQETMAREPGVLISASTDLDSDSAFLQVIAWDDVSGSYQFYDRRDGVWFWAGSSWDALADDSRAQGPFDSHVNGALNMKELKAPWVHWHSQASPILDSALAPQDPLRREVLWTGRRQAEEFERTVARPGIERWTRVRFNQSVRNGVLQRLPTFMRQVLETTTINLVSSPTSAAALATAESVQLPLTFFFNADALIEVLGLDPSLSLPRVPAAVYRETLSRYDVGLTDEHFRFQGDTHFVFVVPEPAFEDILILDQLVGSGILSAKLAASLLMVDFANPVFSRRRATLLRCVPADAVTGDPEKFARTFIGAVERSPAAAESKSAESELLANWSLGDSWRKQFEDRLAGFMTAVSAQLGSTGSFAPIFELAESRRREFRDRKLAEFRLTTPITNISEEAPRLEFDGEGGIRQKS